MKKKIKIFFLILISILAAYLSYKIFFKVEDMDSIKQSRVFVTGNMHGSIDYNKISVENFSEQVYLDGSDNLIILGDFGLIWDGSLKDEMLLDELDKKKFNILFVDGTHENFELLNQYPETRIYGGSARQIRDNIYHLKRGEVYLIDNKNFFVMGGGVSDDKAFRIDGESYWKDEMPNEAEFQNAYNNLEKVGFAVDYVLSHSVPSNDLKIIGASVSKVIKPNEMNIFLEEIRLKLKYKKWFHSSYHLDKDITRKHRSIYYDIIEIK